MTRTFTLTAALVLAAAPAFAFPDAFQLTGQDGEQALTGTVRLDPESGDLALTVQGGDDALSFAGKARPRGTGYAATLRSTRGLSGGVGMFSRQRPWSIVVQPKGLRIAVTLTRSSRRLELTGEVDLGPTSAENEALIRSFYEAFARGDGDGMAAVYAPTIHFSDPVFPHLHGSEAGDMWRMLCESKPVVTFSGVRAGERYGVARWEARYELFGNPVVNIIEASFEFEDGAIVRHVDSFPFRPWARQAFGGIANWINEGVLLATVRHITKGQLAKFREDSV